MEDARDFEHVEVKGGRKVNGSVWHIINEKNIAALGLPKIITKEESHEVLCEYAGDWRLGDKCPQSSVTALYERSNTYDDGVWDKVEFDVQFFGDISLSDIGMPTGTRYAINTNAVEDESRKMSFDNMVRYSDLVNMLTPDEFKPIRQCHISAEQSYAIVRNYVIENIDARYARISSNYDFTFVVNKVVPIKPITIKTEIKKFSGGSYVKPRFKTRTQDNKDYVVFEISTQGHKDREKLPPFRGYNLQDLHDNVKHFLDELMANINAPLKECGGCDGTGHILD